MLLPSDYVALPKAAYADMEVELVFLRARLGDLREVLRIQRQRTLEAVHVYQQAHDGSDTMFPDLGELVAWLLAERSSLREALRLAISWSELTDEQMDDLERVAGVSLARLIRPDLQPWSDPSA